MPHATQVADRYHLIQNLREHLQRFLDRKRTWLPFVEDTPLRSKEASPKKAIEPLYQPQAGREIDPSNLISSERKKITSRKKRLSRYEEVMTLAQEGLSQRAIARQLHLSRNTVQHYTPRLTSPNGPRGQGFGTLGRANLLRICRTYEINGMQGTTTVRASST